MTEMNFEDVHKWIERYGATRRCLFLHPEDLEYESEAGSRVRPIEDIALNIDRRSLDVAKLRFFGSPAFRRKTEAEQLRLLEVIGYSADLKAELCSNMHYRRLIIALERENSPLGKDSESPAKVFKGSNG